MLEKQGGVVSHSENRGELPHTSCEDAVAAMQHRLATVTDQRGTLLTPQD
jgi:hypothetical protein